MSSSTTPTIRLDDLISQAPRNQGHVLAYCDLLRLCVFLKLKLGKMMNIGLYYYKKIKSG